MEAASKKKRGRPRLFSQDEEQGMIDAGQFDDRDNMTHRQRQTHHYAGRGMIVLGLAIKNGTLKFPKEFHYLWNPDSEKKRKTEILCELGRWHKEGFTIPCIKMAARQICKEKMKVKDAVCYLRHQRMTAEYIDQ